MVHFELWGPASSHPFDIAYMLGLCTLYISLMYNISSMSGSEIQTNLGVEYYYQVDRCFSNKVPSNCIPSCSWVIDGNGNKNLSLTYGPPSKTQNNFSEKPQDKVAWASLHTKDAVLYNYLMMSLCLSENCMLGGSVSELTNWIDLPILLRFNIAIGIFYRLTPIVRMCGVFNYSVKFDYQKIWWIRSDFLLCEIYI